jgi:hypothetical protein
VASCLLLVSSVDAFMLPYASHMMLRSTKFVTPSRTSPLALRASDKSSNDALIKAQEAARAAVAASLAGTSWVPADGVSTPPATQPASASKPSANGAAGPKVPQSIALDGIPVQRATKADEQRTLRIAALRKESLALAESARKIREEDAEHARVQEEAASVIMACWGNLKRAKKSVEASQVAHEPSVAHSCPDLGITRYSRAHPEAQKSVD